MIGSDPLSQREVEDLNRGRAFVRSLLEAGGSLLAPTVEEGITASAKVSGRHVARCVLLLLVERKYAYTMYIIFIVTPVPVLLFCC